MNGFILGGIKWHQMTLVRRKAGGLLSSISKLMCSFMREVALVQNPSIQILDVKSYSTFHAGFKCCHNSGLIQKTLGKGTHLHHSNFGVYVYHCTLNHCHSLGDNSLAANFTKKIWIFGSGKNGPKNHFLPLGHLGSLTCF